ncbi:hypothetical protein [Dietzia cercidiphylli]|uniref:hypothetical protein n=1 Tax=Dietzia cercidiphylli TaxID=498199 RepID=UPI00223BFCB1|nr:hypothetical protein [Dietzia cercidiphylli]MCT1515308.1 hypothetical protein [Dietzia cercidiphylli]
MTRSHGSQHGGGHSSGIDDMSPGEMLAVLHMAPFLIPVALGLLVTQVDAARAWLVDKGVLVAAAAEPMLALPGLAGDGLDLRRLILLALALICAAMVASWSVRRRRDKARLALLRAGGPR